MVEDDRRIRLVRPGERTPGPSTPGMDRQEAFAQQGWWAGYVRTEPETSSAWHHHGDHDTIAYVVSGALRFEFGRGGSEAVFARPGDFVRIPSRLIHRESTPGNRPCEVVIVRVGTGDSTVNVDGPEDT
jgi:uncharacterized RmlC-like cupin family protein